MPEIGIVLASMNNGMLGGQTVDSTMMPPTSPTSLSVANHCESASAPQGLTVVGTRISQWLMPHYARLTVCVTR